VTVLTVEPASAGARLDRWLSDRLSDLSRARLQALIRDGRVRVDGAVLSDHAPVEAVVASTS